MCPRSVLTGRGPRSTSDPTGHCVTIFEGPCAYQWLCCVHLQKGLGRGTGCDCVYSCLALCDTLELNGCLAVAQWWGLRVAV